MSAVMVVTGTLGPSHAILPVLPAVTGGHRCLSFQPYLSFELDYTVSEGVVSWRCRDKLSLMQHYRPVGLVTSSAHLCIQSSWRLRAPCCQARLRENCGTTGQGKAKTLWQQDFRGEVFSLVLSTSDVFDSLTLEFQATADRNCSCQLKHSRTRLR